MILDDIYRLNRVNLDTFTENFPSQFYAKYLTEFPDLCLVVEDASGSIIGYLIAKMEGGNGDEPRNSHLSALSVASEFRGCGVAALLMESLKQTSVIYKCEFIDLFVRESNFNAIAMYNHLGYAIHKRLPRYYSQEDGFILKMDLGQSKPLNKSCELNLN